MTKKIEALILWGLGISGTCGQMSTPRKSYILFMLLLTMMTKLSDAHFHLQFSWKHHYKGAYKGKKDSNTKENENTSNISQCQFWVVDLCKPKIFCVCLNKIDLPVRNFSPSIWPISPWYSQWFPQIVASWCHHWSFLCVENLENFWFN